MSSHDFVRQEWEEGKQGREEGYQESLSAPLVFAVDTETGSVEGSQVKLMCPVCGNNYTHTGEPVKMLETQQNAVDEPGVRIRYYAYRFPAYCEDGHSFELYVGQHKGETMIAVGKPTANHALIDFVEGGWDPRLTRPL